jgi:tripartite-type tricarboxylate transporter receptor subunit TctC
MCVLAAVMITGLGWGTAGTLWAADEYPSKQINWYIHSGAGGGTDIMSRMVAMPLRKILKTDIVISTLSGGSGARMLNTLLEAPADGYTIVSLTNSNIATIVRGKTKCKMSDLTGIARGTYDPQSFVVAANGRFKTIQDAVAFAKANPEQLKFGITHMAGVDQVSAYQFSKAAGFKPTFVPFKGGGEVVVAVINGTVDLGVLNPSEFASMYDAGKVKPVVFLLEERLESFKDVPTAKELGWDVEAATWRGFGLKAGTPAPIVQKLRESFMKAMGTSMYKNYLKDNSMDEKSIQDGEKWEAFLKKEYPIWETAMKELGYVK